MRAYSLLTTTTRRVRNLRASCYVANNNEQLPVAFIRHRSPKTIVHGNYSSANPNPRSNQLADTQDILSVSAFLQHPTWPMCTKPAQCQKPTIIHRPDLAVVFEELRQHVSKRCQQVQNSHFDM